jgi:hypothetical protein
MKRTNRFWLHVPSNCLIKNIIWRVQISFWAHTLLVSDAQAERMLQQVMGSADTPRRFKDKKLRNLTKKTLKHRFWTSRARVEALLHSGLPERQYPEA